MSSAALDSALPHGYQGSAFTDNTQQSTLEVQLPFYSNTRFMLAAHFETVSSAAGEPLIQNPTMKQTLAGKLVYTGRDAHANVMQQWHAAGDDFSLHSILVFQGFLFRRLLCFSRLHLEYLEYLLSLTDRLTLACADRPMLSISLTHITS
jgi:hypothetical protein